MQAIKVNNLVKKYGSTIAVNNISFNVDAGSIFAFLGANGAGKSTTIDCITTTQNFDSGQIFVNGRKIGLNDDDTRREIGVVFQTSILDDLLSVKENLLSRAAFYKLGKNVLPKIEELAKTLDMKSFINQRYGTLSGGQKRRADIARALIHGPNILFLDEPTAGLDPASREQVWQTVYSMQADIGLTVFLTTHYMEETEKADLVYVIDKGRVVAKGNPANLRAEFSQNLLKIIAINQKKLISQLREKNIRYFVKNENISISVDTSKIALTLLKKYESNIKDFEFIHGNMDDVFLNLRKKHNSSERLKNEF